MCVHIYIYIYGIYDVPSTVLNPLCISTHLTLTTTLERSARRKHKIMQNAKEDRLE